MASMLLVADLPDNPDALRAIILAQEEERRVLKDQVVALKTAGVEADAEIARLTAIIAAFQTSITNARIPYIQRAESDGANERISCFSWPGIHLPQCFLAIRSSHLKHE